MILLLALACLPRPSTTPVAVAAQAQDEALRLVFLGDSGYLPGGTPCTWRADGSAAERCHVQVDELARLRAAIRAQEPDAIYALGDLVYPVAPACRQPRGRDLEALQAKVGAVYADLGAPAWLVLGNHDVGHRARGPRRERCLLAWAEDAAGIELPGLQYVVDHGLATVVVPDSNLKDPALLPAAELRAALQGGDWVVVAAHHELHTAFEKMDGNVIDPPPASAWLAGLGVAPHLWANGHAHTLQVGRYDARALAGVEGEPLPVLAVTSGAGSKLRAHPTCAERDGVDPADAAACAAVPEGERPTFALSRFGFAVVDLTPETMTLRMLDLDGVELFRWERTKDDAGPL